MLANVCAGAVGWQYGDDDVDLFIMCIFGRTKSICLFGAELHQRTIRPCYCWQTHEKEPDAGHSHVIRLTERPYRPMPTKADR